MLFVICQTFVIGHGILLFVFVIRCSDSLFMCVNRFLYMRYSKFFSNNTFCAVTNNYRRSQDF